jgi:hypothetical protein
MVKTARPWPWPWLAIAGLTASLALAAVAAAEPPLISAGGPPPPVRSALEKGSYPWYDAKADAVKPVWPPREWNLDWLDRWLRGKDLDLAARAGDWVAIVLAMLGMLILLAVLGQLWRLYRPGAAETLASARGPGTASRIEGLPEGLRPETHDPWAEAVRYRAQGDYARAVVCLFAHQLLTLDRLRQIRLVPGRTGRQLVRAIADGEFRAWLDPTLRLFEAVYYGHRTPTAEAFEPVWAAAEAFQRRVAEGAMP